MINCLGGGEFAAEAKLTRAAIPGAIVLVEGSSDYKLFSKLFDSKKKYILPTNGRQNLRDALAILNKEAFQGVLGIVDADFLHIHGKKPKIKNLLVTDEHDIEIMLIKSKAFEEVLKEYASSSKIENFFKVSTVKKPKTWLFHESDFLGRLRLVATIEGLPLKFEGLNFSKFVSRSSLKLNKDRCVNAVMANSTVKGLKSKTILDNYSKLPKSISKDQLNCGHDLIEILAIGLRRCWGSQSNVIADALNLEKLLRIAYSIDEFKKTGLYKRILGWQRRNRPYQLFD